MKLDEYDKKYPCFDDQGKRYRFWWNFNTYLAQTIVDGLKKLRQSSMCYPSSLTLRQWEKIMSDMQEGFQLYIDNDGDSEFAEWKNGKCPTLKQMTDKKVDYHKKFKLLHNKRKQKKFEKAKQLLVKYWDQLWD